MSLADALIRQQYVNPEIVARAIAEASRLPYIDVRGLQIQDHIIQLIPECVARENGVLPIDESNGGLVVLVSDPSDLETIEKLRFILNRNIVPMVSTADAIAAAINHYYGQVEGESADSMLQEFTDTQIDFTETEFDDACDNLTSFAWGRGDKYDITSCVAATSYAGADLDDDGAFFVEDFIPPARSARKLAKQKLLRPTSPGGLAEAPIVRLVELMIQEAIKLRASHILLLPKEDCFTVAYIIDGSLVERDSPPLRVLSATINRFKILAKLDLGDRQKLQSGTIGMDIGGVQAVLTINTVGNDLLVELPAASSLTEQPEVVKNWFSRRVSSESAQPSA
jgi:type IV pilus assembly protein PilB